MSGIPLSQLFLQRVSVWVSSLFILLGSSCNSWRQTWINVVVQILHQVWWIFSNISSCLFPLSAFSSVGIPINCMWNLFLRLNLLLTLCLRFCSYAMLGNFFRCLVIYWSLYSSLKNVLQPVHGLFCFILAIYLISGSLVCFLELFVIFWHFLIY